MIYEKGLQEGKGFSDVFDTHESPPSKDGKDEDKKSKLSTAQRYDKLNHYETQAYFLTSSYVKLGVP